jgi:hypothetical protein
MGKEQVFVAIFGKCVCKILVYLKNTQKYLQKNQKILSAQKISAIFCYFSTFDNFFSKFGIF